MVQWAGRLADWYMSLPETWILAAICVMLFILAAPWQVTAWITGGLVFLYFIMWSS